MIIHMPVHMHTNSSRNQISACKYPYMHTCGYIYIYICICIHMDMCVSPSPSLGPPLSAHLPAAEARGRRQRRKAAAGLHNFLRPRLCVAAVFFARVCSVSTGHNQKGTSLESPVRSRNPREPQGPFKGTLRGGVERGVWADTPGSSKSLKQGLFSKSCEDSKHCVVG